MGFMSVAVNGETERKREAMEKGRSGSGQSATEAYLDSNPTAPTNAHPDSPAAVPGLFAPRNVIGSRS